MVRRERPRYLDRSQQDSSGSSYACVQLLRVYQWPKNVLVFAGILFVFPDSLVRIPEALVLFAAFCAASSFVYIINDLADKTRDQRHPNKRLRPIASGAITPSRPRS
jgi:decaprenyl-phosphate phosphoribosyltransferase